MEEKGERCAVYVPRRNGAQPFVRVFCPFWAKSTGKTGKKKRKKWIFGFFLRFFRPGSLENHPRRPPASFCTHPELRKPKFDQFRPNFHICFNLFDPPKYEHPTFSFYFFKNRPRNHAQIVDLAESFRLVQKIPQKT